MTDVDAIVERLRGYSRVGVQSPLLNAAADALVALKEERDQLARFMGQKGMEDWDAMKAENERLRAALEEIAGKSRLMVSEPVLELARAALKAIKQEDVG